MTLILLCFLLLALTATSVASARGNPTAAALNRGLARTPMRGLGQVLDEEGRRANVSPYLIAAIAGLESSYGAHPCRSNTRNVWGLASCKRGYGIPFFASWRQAIRFQAQLLRRGWLAKGVRDVYTIGRSYCPPCGNGWGAKVAWFMRSLGGSVRVTYRP
ncbi:MAG: hypothetical protein NUW01_04460 [Gemmatimonadaceae bacterium]|nr:hypothetical protein [Gemmatimonadaceae bacterium]